MVAALRRLASPMGLLLAGLCAFLPFLTVSCEPTDPDGRLRPSGTYSGVDLVGGGRADLRVPEYDPAAQVWHLRSASDTAVFGKPQTPLPRQPLAVVAYSLIAAGFIGAWVVKPRLRAAIIAACSLASAVLILAATLHAGVYVASVVAMEGPIQPPPDYSKLISTRYGLWLTFGLLVLVGMGNVAAAFPSDGRRTPDPVQSAEPIQSA